MGVTWECIHVVRLLANSCSSIIPWYHPLPSVGDSYLEDYNIVGTMYVLEVRWD